MSMESIQDLLAFVEMPSRYLGSEINSIRKESGHVKLRMALAYPDLYEIGTSHFGIQILYHLLNQQSWIAAERVFAPASDMEQLLRKHQIPLSSLECKRPLANFDIIGFSLLYEMNYTNVLNMLELAKLPLCSQQRDEDLPLIVAGGPCTCNPEPVADFFDAMVIGDGERAILQMCEVWLEWKKSGRPGKEALLRQWARIEGIYVPRFFVPQYDQGRILSINSELEDYRQVRKAVVEDLEKSFFPQKPIIPFGKPIHDRLRLEISRGCTRGCRFCQAGMIYRPVRERSPQQLMEMAEICLGATGYEDLSLLSLSTGDYRCLSELMHGLMERFSKEHVAISLPSIRAGSLSAELMQLIQKVRKTGFTIAPEAGSQRLRDIINKNIGKEDIISTVKSAFSLGWQVIKLYFMVGLPMERQADLQAIVDLIRELHQIRGPEGQKGKINVSVASFIPKPHTPFQWCAQASLAEAKEKIDWLRSHLKLPGIQFKWQNPEVSQIEGLMARGGRKLSTLLIEAHRQGCKFDGWSDQFRFEKWQAAMEKCGIELRLHNQRERKIEEMLAWDHIDQRIDKNYLIKEWQKAVTGETTIDCRLDACNQCGVCDFVRIAPKLSSQSGILAEGKRQKNHSPIAASTFRKIQILYSKTGPARFFGHLEMMRIILRALKRAGIALKFTEGFHPMPKVSFEDPLPLGMESKGEKFFISVPISVDPHSIASALNRHLPKGLMVQECRMVMSEEKRTQKQSTEYEVTIKDGFFDENSIKLFNNCKQVSIVRTNRKGKEKSIDLKERIICLSRIDDRRLMLSLKEETGFALRPLEIIDHVFDFSQDQMKSVRVVKLK